MPRPKGYERPAETPGCLRLRAWTRIVCHEYYPHYADDLDACYVTETGGPFTRERLAEFEMRLNDDLEVEPFNEDDGPPDGRTALVPVPFAARVLCVAPSTIHRWISKGKLPFILNNEPSIIKKGHVYYANYLMLVDYKDAHYQGNHKLEEDAA